MAQERYRLDQWVLEVQPEGIVLAQANDESGVARQILYENLSLNVSVKSNLTASTLLVSTGCILASLWGTLWARDHIYAPILFWAFVLFVSTPLFFTGLYKLLTAFAKTYALTFSDKLSGLFVRIIHREGLHLKRTELMLKEVESHVEGSLSNDGFSRLG